MHNDTLFDVPQINCRLPKAIAAWIFENPGKVAEVDYGGGYSTDSGNAFDVLLAPGWCCGTDYACHTIIEQTAKDTLRELRLVQRCNCAECVATMKTDKFLDKINGEGLKTAGMELAANNRRELLDYARKLAVSIARERPDRCVNADDVFAALASRGFLVSELGNAAGSLFKGSQWQWTGQLVKSSRPRNHRNLLRVWRYIVDGEEQTT